MKRFRYGHDDLRKILVTVGVIVVISYFVIYVIEHWDIIVIFLQSRSQTEMRAILLQLRSKTVLNFVILILLTTVTAAIPFMPNAISAMFNGVVCGPGIRFLMNVFSNILGSFIFIKILKMIDITNNEKKLKNRFAGTDTLENTDFGTILGYMIPVVSTILVSYHVAETRPSWYKWLLYITTEMAPNSSVYAFGGDVVVAGNFKCIVMLLVIAAAVYSVVTYLKRRGKEKA